MERNPLLKDHLGYLDGIRAVTALYVVTCHVWLTVYEHIPYPAFFKLFVFGRQAVDMFIVLSGFCLTLPVLRNHGALPQGAMKFFVRRAWRILPPYYAAIGVCMAFIFLFLHTRMGNCWDPCFPVTLRSFLFHIGMVNDFMDGRGDGSINYVFWSIAVEWRIYFLFPLMLWAARKIGLEAMVLAVIFLSAVAYVVVDLHLGIRLTSNFFGLFAMGVWGAYIAYGTGGKWARIRTWPWEWLTVGAAMLAALTSFVHAGLETKDAGLKEYFFGLFSVCLIITASFRGSWPHRFLSLSPLVYVGTFAYSIYLIHAPILTFVFEKILMPFKLSPLQTWAWLAALGLPAVVLSAYVFFRLFEYPFLKKKNRGSGAPVEVSGVAPVLKQPLA